MTLSLGMQADYAGLIEKHQLESLGMIRDADKFAQKLLALNPDAADAYLTLGAANYIIGSLPALKRFYLKFKGIDGDKRVGIQQLEIAATRGRYLRPFAKILLAMAALREKKFALARIQLAELVAEFPENALFVSELAKLDASPEAGAHSDASAATSGLNWPKEALALLVHRRDSKLRQRGLSFLGRKERGPALWCCVRVTHEASVLVCDS
jgi:tetratricopeptide (TPR) repeat protein